MKKIFMVVFFILLVLPLISAVQISMNSNFSQGETLIAKVSGNFIDQVAPGNVFFYRGHVRIPITYDVGKIGNDFYIYALLTGKTQADYSLSIEGLRYFQGTQIVNDNIVNNFTITNATADFSVNPGFSTSGVDFSLNLQNLQDNPITVTYGLKTNSSTSSGGFFASFFGTGSNNSQTKGSITLNPGIKNVSFSVAGFSQGLNTFELSSANTDYLVPIYANINNASGNQSGTPIGGTKSMFKFQPSSVVISMATNSNSTRILYLTNTGKETVENILFNISNALFPYVIISPGKIDSLSASSTKQIGLGVSSRNAEGTVNGEIAAYTNDSSSSFALTLNFIKDFIPQNTSSRENTTIITTCSDFNGTICTVTQQCTGNSSYARDGVCCLASCQEPKPNYTGTVIGWGLLILALIIIYFFYKRRYSQVQRKNPF